jgi:hypothetical protein
MDRVAGWRADVGSLIPEMDGLHPKLDHGTPLVDLEAAATELSDRVPALSDNELMVGVLRIVAMVSTAGCDAHTGAYVWGEGTYSVTSLPLRLWVFPDGVRVVDALEPQRDLIGARLDAMGGHPIDAVRAAVDPLIPRDNDSTVELLLPRFLLMPEILRGLGLAGDGPLEVALTMPDGEVTTRTIQPIPMADYNAWAGPYGLHLPVDPAVPYLARIGDLLWWRRLDDGSLVIQWNRVEHVPQSDLAALRSAIAEPATARVVLDVRHNFGGEVSALQPIADLMADPSVDRPGRLFVLTGRNTFSAASLIVARLDARPNATIVGEPMGGCPTSYGDPDPVVLPFSGIQVDVARTLEIGVDAGDARPTIEPDLPAPLTFEAWRSKMDPSLEAVAAAAGATR